MKFNQVAIVVNRRGSTEYPDFDIRQIEGPLRCTNLAENIDIIYNQDYEHGCGNALIDYCRRNNPDIILLCLQGAKAGEIIGPSVGTCEYIKKSKAIPTVVFWFDTHSDEYVELLEKYSGAVTLNLVGGSDSSSHKPIESSNYVYSSLAFDESYFDRTEVKRDIDIGFLGTVRGNRGTWIDGLAKHGLKVFVSGGQFTSTWMTFEEYCQLTSRFKIAINFASLGGGGLSELLRQSNSRKVLFNPHRLKTVISSTLGKPRYQIRSRVFEAMWLKTFVLEEDNPITSQYFMPYVDYVPFTTLDDLTEKIKYYLRYPPERDWIRMNGYRAVKKYYNARLYLESIVRAAQGNYQTGEIWNKAHFEKCLSKGK